MSEDLSGYQPCVGQALAEDFKSNASLQTRQYRAHAEVHTMTKGEMTISGPLDLELISIAEYFFVAVSRAVDEQQ